MLRTRPNSASYGTDGTEEGEGDRAHQRLSREHLQERDEIVSISEVLVQVSDMSLGLGTQEDTWR